MDCPQVKPVLSCLVDGHLIEAERRAVLAHLEVCPECVCHYEELHEVRMAVRALPARPVSPNLALLLRVAASREASRRRRFHGILAACRAWSEGFMVRASGLMRPLALPAAGGIASAVLLFAMVMPNFQGLVRAHADDVPTILFTGATVKSSLELALSEDEVSLELFVDERGRVIDYAFPDRLRQLDTAATRRQLENSLLFTEFQPATSFGQPTAGWVRVSLRRSQIEVKG